MPPNALNFMLREKVALAPVTTLAIACAALVFASALFPSSAVAEEPQARPVLVASGERIYAKRCAVCHGGSGEGVAEHYDKPLVGDRSLVELARLIEETMPEDDPGACVGDDAEAVAAYIYDAFYSPIAQARNQPARVELSRLTVRQYRQSIADLVASFHRAARWGETRGLRGEYFTSRRLSDKERKLTRVDPVVDFDFDEASPVPGEIEAEQFGVRWQGSVLAMETGEYEFILETENGARLWVNDLDHALIDAGVRSGTDIHAQGAIWLIGGRAYPLRLEVFKSKEAKEKSARIALRWRPPRREACVIPARSLSPEVFPPTLIVSTPFPPDDASLGYERGTSISAAWEQATTQGAIEAATYVAAHAEELAGPRDRRRDRGDALREFCHQFAQRAFRRPLDDEARRLYIDRQFEGETDAVAAVKRVALLVLKSPRFLYQELSDDRDDSYEVAARLSFAMWDSIPDGSLWKKSETNARPTEEQVRAQAARMLDDPRTRGKIRDFFLQWLRVDRFDDIAKDTRRFPEFDEQVVSDLRDSLDLLLDDAVWGQDSDFRKLLLTESLHVNGRLARFFDIALPDDATFQLVDLPAGQRAGVLTHPFLMAGNAYTATSSPIHRGVFVARGVLGRTLRPPPEAVSPLAPDAHADLTTRERVELQTKAEACQSCHRMINPLGFAFEHFDAVGRYRVRERGKTIDASGEYLTRDGETITFANVRELASFLADSQETQQAFVEQLFHYLVKQPIRAYPPEQVENLRESFARNDFSVRQLLVEIATLAALAPAGAAQTTPQAAR